MSLYNIICSVCDKVLFWGSATPYPSVCEKCRNFTKDKEVEVMDYKQAHLDSLNKIVSVQNELITFLKSEIERLKLNSLYIHTPQTSPATQPFSIGYDTRQQGSAATFTEGVFGTTSSSSITVKASQDGSGIFNWPEAPESVKPKKKK